MIVVDDMTKLCKKQTISIALSAMQKSMLAFSKKE